MSSCVLFIARPMLKRLCMSCKQKAISNERLHQIDGDTYAGPDSLEAALRGAGGACALVDQVMGEGGVGFFSDAAARSSC